jgi:outer membrane protein assembly factor BamB
VEGACAETVGRLGAGVGAPHGWDPCGNGGRFGRLGDLWRAGDDEVPTRPERRPPALKEPFGLAVAGGDLFVSNFGSNSVTELDAANGAFVRVVWLPKVVGGVIAFSQFGPWVMAVTGGKLFVLNYDGNSVTEFDATNGHLVLVIH